MSIPICECDAKAFINKYRTELELIFQSKYKNVLPISEDSEATTLDSSEEIEETLYPSEITLHGEDETPSENYVAEVDEVPEVNEVPEVTEPEEFKEILQVKEIQGAIVVAKVKDIHGLTTVLKIKDVPDVTEVPDVIMVIEVKESPEVTEAQELKEIHGLTTIQEEKEVPEVNDLQKVPKEVTEKTMVKEVTDVPETKKRKVVHKAKGLEKKMEPKVVKQVPDVPSEPEVKKRLQIKEAPDVKFFQEGKMEAKRKEKHGLTTIPEVKEVPEVTDVPELKQIKGIKEVPEIKERITKSLEGKMEPKDVPEVKQVNEVEVVPNAQSAPEIKKVLKVKMDVGVTTGDQHRSISFSEKVQVINLPTPPSTSASEPNSESLIEIPSEEIISVSIFTPIIKQQEVPTLKNTLLDRFSHIDSKAELLKKKQIAEEYLRLDTEIKADKKKMINMLQIIEENVNEAASSGIKEILLKYLKRNMNDVQDLFSEIRRKETEIEKLDKIQVDIEEREKFNLEIWNLIQKLSKAIESLHVVQPDMNRIIQENTEDEREKEEMEEEEIYDKHSKKAYYLFREHTEISGEDFSEEQNEEENFYSDILEISDDFNPRTKDAAYYLKSRKIYQFFRFLGAHLVVAHPENPISFLVDLLDRFCKYRCGECSPPLLFEKRHVESIYNSLDPMHFGEITLDQYFNGLFSLGLYKYKGSHNQHIMIERDIFISDACRKLKEQLDKMLYFPGQSLMILSPTNRSSRTSSSLSRSG